MVMLKLAKPAREKFRVRQIGDRLWEVIDPDGERVDDPYASLCAACAKAGQQQAKADRAAKRQTRACMTCQDPFASEGIHNRMCDDCRAGRLRTPITERRRA